MEIISIHKSQAWKEWLRTVLGPDNQCKIISKAWILISMDGYYPYSQPQSVGTHDLISRVFDDFNFHGTWIKKLHAKHYLLSKSLRL